MEIKMGRVRVSRRTVLAGLAATSSSIAMPNVVRANPRRFVIGTNGGVAYENFYSAILQHFERAHNVEVVPVFGGGSELLNQVLAERANPTMDCVVTFQGAWLIGKAEGVLEKVNYNNIDHIEDVPEFLHDPDGYAPYVNLGAWGLVYDTSMVSQPPASFKALWDEEYAGQIMIGGISHWQIHLAAFAHAWTGDQHNIDAAFEKVKELAPSLAGFYGLSSDAQSKFQQGLASVATWYSYTAHRVAQLGIPLQFRFPEEGAFLYPQAYHAVKGTENVDLVEKMIGMIYDPELAVPYAASDGYAPCSSKAVLPPELKGKILSFDEITRSHLWDWEFVNANQGDWLTRWNAEVRPLVGG
ncbi:extracellular solute-binding protein [Mesorhizobium sp. CAU 1741]|uniref:extracellular solute-binding protein n=1 Tax=Mesorhizobium sp. CAU 1741 TaxID=3140366 RepID=UPI00325A61B8